MKYKAGFRLVEVEDAQTCDARPSWQRSVGVGNGPGVRVTEAVWHDADTMSNRGIRERGDEFQKSSRNAHALRPFVHVVSVHECAACIASGWQGYTVSISTSRCSPDSHRIAVTSGAV